MENRAQINNRNFPGESEAGESDESPSPVTTLTVFGFPAGARGWAFAQMAFARPLLIRVEGMRFRKLMGAGRGLGFTLRPDWSRYALLAAWDNERRAREFLDDSPFMRRYRRRAGATASVILRTLSSHGTWNGRTPFLPSIRRPSSNDESSRQESPVDSHPGMGDVPPARLYRSHFSSSNRKSSPIENPIVAVLTRATIRPSRLRPFWSQVKPVGDLLEGAPGLLASIGIGEAPFIRQATFSIWQSEEAMREFAYRSPEHREVIRRTREEGWYSEEMFTRFAVIEIIGDFPPAGLDQE